MRANQERNGGELDDSAMTAHHTKFVIVRRHKNETAKTNQCEPVLYRRNAPTRKPANGVATEPDEKLAVNKGGPVIDATNGGSLDRTGSVFFGVPPRWEGTSEGRMEAEKGEACKYDMRRLCESAHARESVLEEIM